MRSAGIWVFFSMLVTGAGPFGLLGAFTAIKLWQWFLMPWLRVATPPFEQIYLVIAIVGFFRSARYVKDGNFDWKDALVESWLTPALLLSAGFLIHVLIGRSL